MAFMQAYGAINPEDFSMNKPKKQKATYYALKSFLSYLNRYRWKVAGVFGVFVLSNILIAIIPVFVGQLVGALADEPRGDVYLYVWILIACSTGHDILWRASELLYRRYLNGVSFEYETVVFEHAIRKPYPYFVDKFTGKIASYTNSLGQEFREFMEHVFWEYAGHAVNLVTVCIVLTAINWQTGLVFAGGLVLLFITGMITVHNTIKYEKIWSDVRSTKNGKIFDALSNFVNVKSFQKESNEVVAIKREQAKTIDAANRSFGWNIVFWGSMSQVIRNLVWPASIVLNVYLYLHGYISLADLTTFLTAVVLFTNYIWNIIWSISQFSLQMARAEEAYTYMFGNVNIIHNGISTPKQTTMPQFESSLILSDITFAYPDKPDLAILNQISITIKKGEKVGIVGKSGSGKTTLTKLLLDYYSVSDGQLTLDERPVRSNDLCALVSYVPQDTSLFHRTIAENISYATDSKPTSSDITRAAKRAHAHEFITRIDDGYDALVGERGVKLSAGQRQRIAIARAFLDDKPILVLDEATSALDSESEILVQKALEDLWEDKTVIAIAHRLSTLRNMDRIMVMESGRIVEQGTHAELLNQNGIYAGLWAHQSDGFLSE